MDSKIWLSSPHMGGTEQHYVNEAFTTNWIAPLGPNVDGFEKDIVEFTNCAHAAALSSGTAALHLALILLGVGPGDYVICQSMTFSASANPILYLGATPIFVDSEENTWNMCPKALEEAIEACVSGKINVAGGKSANTQLPKAVIPVHLYGMPADMESILNICQSYGIPVIEDAAEAMGSTLHGKACGTFGDIGIYSFNGNKIITTSGGGALVSQNKNWVDQARFLATQARDAAPHYQHSHVGYNYRLSNVLAGIGRGQMEVLPKRVEKRRENFEYYMQRLSGVQGISFIDAKSGYYSNCWLTCILIDPHITHGIDREKIRLHLNTLNIESRPLWKPMHLQPVFQSYSFFGGNVAEGLFDRGLCLPSGSNLSQEDIERVVEGVLTII
jgi:dTDP-4-amino-4,6-dideoxygalactose transaminase